MGKKILLVDDEIELLTAVQARLEANGFQVDTATDGEAGLKKAMENKYDLIILDVMMPKMDGYKVCATLKYDARYSHTPILLFTARASDEDERMGLEDCKADGYLTKPFDAQAFLKRIQELFK